MYHFPLAKPIEACPKVHRLSVNICAVVPGSKHRVTWLIITIINVQRCYRRYCSAPTRIHTPIRYTLAPNGKMPRLECWRWSFLINVALYWSCGLFSFEFRFDDGRCCDESAGIGRKLRAHFWIIHFFFVQPESAANTLVRRWRVCFRLRRWLGEVACETKADEVCRWITNDNCAHLMDYHCLQIDWLTHWFN